MHTKCGYTFDKDGTIAALTPQEERRLWRGLALWNKEVENQGEGSGSRTDAERKKATAADKRHFHELAEESNAEQD